MAKDVTTFLDYLNIFESTGEGSVSYYDKNMDSILIASNADEEDELEQTTSCIKLPLRSDLTFFGRDVNDFLDEMFLSIPMHMSPSQYLRENGLMEGFREFENSRILKRFEGWCVENGICLEE